MVSPSVVPTAYGYATSLQPTQRFHTVLIRYRSDGGWSPPPRLAGTHVYCRFNRASVHRSSFCGACRIFATRCLLVDHVQQLRMTNGRFAIDGYPLYELRHLAMTLPLHVAHARRRRRLRRMRWNWVDRWNGS